jgi:iron(III) transport system substrate-binding protein
MRAPRFLNTAGVIAALLALAPLHARAEDWKTRWDATLAAAEQEGALDVSGPSGKLWTDALTTFQAAYPKIKLAVTPAASRDFWPRLIKEREVGRHLWDLRIGGADTEVYELIPEHAIADVRAMYILPEVADESVWYGGFDHMFTDLARKYAPSFGAYSSPLAFYNPKFVKAADLSSFEKLLDPKWKGKIALADPRGGSTAVSMAIVYKKFGPDFIRDLLSRQEPAIVSNPRQIMDWFVSGRYPIAMGIPSDVIQQFAAGGVKFEMGRVSGLDIWSVGVCGIQVIEPRPHPAATTLFVNWLLSRDTQTRIMAAVHVNSRRKDVPIEDPGNAIDWSRYKDYVSGQSEEYYQAMADFKKLARSVLK